MPYSLRKSQTDLLWAPRESIHADIVRNEQRVQENDDGGLKPPLWKFYFVLAASCFSSIPRVLQQVLFLLCRVHCPPTLYKGLACLLYHIISREPVGTIHDGSPANGEAWKAFQLKSKALGSRRIWCPNAPAASSFALRESRRIKQRVSAVTS